MSNRIVQFFKAVTKPVLGLLSFTSVTTFNGTSFYSHQPPRDRSSSPSTIPTEMAPDDGDDTGSPPPPP